jgi:tRNA(adenine34) deaminase
MNHNDEYYMSEALKEARKAEILDEVPVGVVIVRNDEIIARGYNLKESLKNALAHGEIIAIKKASEYLGGWRLIGCTMYVTLEPCVMCAGAIMNSRIERLVIGTTDDRMGGCGSVVNLVQHPQLNHDTELEWGVLESECRSILQNFFKKLRERKKEQRKRRKQINIEGELS